MQFLKILAVSFFATSITGTGRMHAQTNSVQKIIALYPEKEATQPGDWLYSNEELLCDLACYKKSEPQRRDSVRRVLYIYSLGENTDLQDSLIQSVSEYLRLIFHLETKITGSLSITGVPDSLKRGSGEDLQVQTHFIMDSLIKILPQDGFAALCLTKYDLYSEDSGGFVFGQAYTSDRGGICSYYRYGDLNNPADFPSILLRLLKVSSHETAHLFTIKHCQTYRCVMNGSNSLYEQDKKPVHFCPDCLEKLVWNLGFDLEAHFRGLMTFYSRNSMTTEAGFVNKNLSKLRN